MASSINASTSGAGGVITTADNTGNLNIQSGGSTVLALTSSGVAITGTLSATTISGAGGMTLLGTLTTTSGTTQTLSGLTLTSYKYLFFSYLNVGWTAGASTLVKASTTVGLARDSNTASESISGNLMLDLSTGVYSAMTGRHTTGTTEQQLLSAVVSAGIIPSWNTSTTSLSFGSSPSYTFTSGTIKVYGVA